MVFVCWSTLSYPSGGGGGVFSLTYLKLPYHIAKSATSNVILMSKFPWLSRNKHKARICIFIQHLKHLLINCVDPTQNQVRHHVCIPCINQLTNSPKTNLLQWRSLICVVDCGKDFFKMIPTHVCCQSKWGTFIHVDCLV